MSLKLRITPYLPVISLLIIIVCLGISNYYWLSLNSQPLVDDESFHLLSALKYREILLHPGWDIFAKLLTVDNFYPPLMPLLAAVFSLIFAKSNTMILCMSNLIFMSVTCFSLFFLGLKIKKEWAGVLASALLIMYPMVFHLTRMFMLETALISMVTVTITLLIYSNHFEDRKFAIWAGIAGGIGLLTKQTILAFLVGPVLFFLLFPLTKDRKNLLNKWSNFLFFCLILILIALPWYWTSINTMLTMCINVIFNQGFVPERNPVLSLTSLTYYLRLLFNEQMGIFFFVIFTVFVPLKFKIFPLKTLFIIWIIIPYLILSILPNKFYYYSLSILPAIAFLTAYSLLEISSHFWKKITISFILFVGILSFLHCSFLSPFAVTKILYGSFFSPRQSCDFQIEAIKKQILNEKLDHTPMIGTLGIDGNFLVGSFAKNIGDNYLLVNDSTWHYYLLLQGLKWDIIHVDNNYTNHPDRNTKIPDFLLSANIIPPTFMQNVIGHPYEVKDIYQMPDHTQIFLYKKSTAASEAITDTTKAHFHPQTQPPLEINNGPLRISLLRNTWKIFWKNIDLTEHLSLFSSMRIGGRQLDSKGGAWTIDKINNYQITAYSHNPHYPVVQKWELSLEGQILRWRVKNFSWLPLPIEREESNVMLSGNYTNWEYNNQAGTFAEAERNEPIDGNKVILKIMPASSVCLQANDSTGRLPGVSFCQKMNKKNLTSRIFLPVEWDPGRVLQYITYHQPLDFKWPGEYQYFEGYLEFTSPTASLTESRPDTPTQSQKKIPLNFLHETNAFNW